MSPEQILRICRNQCSDAAVDQWFRGPEDSDLCLSDVSLQQLVFVKSGSCDFANRRPHTLTDPPPMLLFSSFHYSSPFLQSFFFFFLRFVFYCSSFFLSFCFSSSSLVFISSSSFFSSSLLPSIITPPSPSFSFQPPQLSLIDS